MSQPYRSIISGLVPRCVCQLDASRAELLGLDQHLTLQAALQGKGKTSPVASASKQAASPAPIVHTGSSKSVGSAPSPRVEEPATPAQSKPGKKQVSSLSHTCLGTLRL